MGQEEATLEVGFAINVEDSFGNLRSLDDMIGKVSADAVREFTRIEAIAKNLSFGGNVVSINSFGAAATRELESVRQAVASAEKAGESLSRQLDRQASTFGKTSSEIRAMKVETAALAAEQQGLTELATRLRTQEAGLYEAEFAASRAARIEAEAAAEQKQVAAQLAVAAATKEADAVRAAAQAYQMFEARAREGAAAMRSAEVAAAGEAASVAALRAALDPAAAATSRAAAQLATYTDWQKRGIITSEELAGAEKLLVNGSHNLGSAHSGASVSTMLLQHSVRATADSMAAGLPLTMILGEQIGRLGEAAALSGGSFGKVGKILSGPWGIALTAGISLLTILVPKLWESGDASEAAGKGHEHNASATDALTKAVEALNSATGLEHVLAVQALADQEKSVVAEKNQAAAKLATARATLVKAQTDAASAAASNVPGTPSYVGAGANELATAAYVKSVQANVTALASEVDKAETSLRGLATFKLDKSVEAQFDKNTAAVQRFDIEHERLVTAFGKGLLSEDRYREGMVAATKARDAVTKATSGGVGASNALSDAQGRLAGASGAVQHAEAQLALTRIQTAAAVRANTMTEMQRSAAIADGVRAVNAAKEATKGHAEAARDAAKAIREQEEAEKKLQQTLVELVGKYDPATKAAMDYRDALDKISHVQAGGMIDQHKAVDWGLKAADDYGDALKKIDEQQNALSHFGFKEVDTKALSEQLEKLIDPALKVQDVVGDISAATNRAAESMGNAFGSVGTAIGGVIKVLGDYGVREAEIAKAVKENNITTQQGAKKTADLQLNSLIEITDSAKNLFSAHSKGYKAMEAAEKALTLVQLARTAVDVAGGAARMFASLGPLAFPAVAAMIGVMASLGFAGGGSSTFTAKTDDGTGTILGDTTAKSDSVQRSIDALKNVDTITMTYTRDMLASLRSIDSQIGGLASLLVRTGNLDGSASGVTQGFTTSGLGKVLGSTLIDPTGLLSKIPVLGGIVSAISGVIKSLFGTKTTVIGQGISASDQSLQSILSGGFDAETYSDIQKKKKFLGITTSTKVKTQYGDLDDSIQQQFGLILKSFDDSITAAAGPLGLATSDITKQLDNFVVSFGKIDLQGLSGTEIQEKLEAVFGAIGDNMAAAAIPGLDKYEQVGEGYLATLVRVASTVETVTVTLEKLGNATASLGVDASMGIASQFDSISDFTSAADSYFSSYYSQAEQAAAIAAQLGKVFGSLGLAMPDTLAGFRQLVEAQDLTSAAGQATYATLLQLAPAFADLKTSMEGAKSAADILSEREDLQRQILEAQGDTAAIRALDLAKLDESNRGLQEQLYAIQDAKDAADAAATLAQAWSTVGESIKTEIDRIRGLTDTSTGGSFATLLSQFNAANVAARGGDQDAAKSLPALSQSLLTAAAAAATSRQELDRVQAQTAAQLEATYAAISGLAGGTSDISDTTASTVAATQASSSTTTAANDDLLTEVRALRAELTQMHADNNAGHATTGTNTGGIKRKLDDVTAASGGDAITIVSAAG